MFYILKGEAVLGQRLVVEIRKTEGDTCRTLAAAYYHWSAYTEDAIEMTSFLINKLSELREKYTDDFELAVRMLEATGAGLNPDEKIRIRHAGILLNFDIQDCENRNRGLLAITEEGIKDLYSWEEGVVVIDIGTKEIHFSVYSEYTKEEYDEYYPDDEYKYDKLKVIPFYMEDVFSFFSFEDFYKLCDVFEMTKSQYGYRLPNGNVVAWIA